MSELIEFWIKVSLVGVCMALLFGAVAAGYDAIKKRKQ